MSAQQRGAHHKPREYPHSSGDRNTFPLTEHKDKDVTDGGRQRVAPTDDGAVGVRGRSGGARSPDRQTPRQSD